MNKEKTPRICKALVAPTVVSLILYKLALKSLKFNDIPLQDEKTNTMFCNGDTSGIFHHLFQSAYDL